jgi:thioredoxin-dependent peroxiredoxin
MSSVTLGGNPFNTVGSLPEIGSSPTFSLTKGDLSATTNEAYAGKRVVLNIFPSVDTPTCATSVRTFNARAAEAENTVVLNVSADLPFAQGRFCGAEGIANAETASSFRSPDFGSSFGVTLADGPLAGLLARAVVVLDESGKVVYTELVPEIAHEPNYDAALNVLK